ncbi:hypothetical protein AOLI_G00011200 [Acnodon oligacanthus]
MSFIKYTKHPLFMYLYICILFCLCYNEKFGHPRYKARSCRGTSYSLNFPFPRYIVQPGASFKVERENWTRKMALRQRTSVSCLKAESNPQESLTPCQQRALLPCRSRESCCGGDIWRNFQLANVSEERNPVKPMAVQPDICLIFFI